MICKIYITTCPGTETDFVLGKISIGYMCISEDETGKKRYLLSFNEPPPVWVDAGIFSASVFESKKDIFNSLSKRERKLLIISELIG